VAGVDLLPFVSGKNKGAHDRLLWRFGQQWAIREGDWKLTTMGDAPPQLYSLRADIGESKDLVAAELARVAAMKTAWDNWNQKNIAPLWTAPRLGGKKGKKKQKA
jgi:arylsulfatase A-like enzyme